MTEFYYREVDQSEVDPQKVKEARHVLHHCEGALRNLPDVKIQWCKETDEANYKMDNSFIKLQSILSRLSGKQSSTKSQYHSEDGSFFGQCYGLTGSKEKGRLIWLRSDIPLDQIGLTVAHECFHLHEFGPLGKYRPPMTGGENEAAEKRAEDFAIETMKKLGDLKTEDEMIEILRRLNKELRLFGESIKI